MQRNLAAPVLSNTECNVQPKAAPALSRALARVLGAVESKENEAEHHNNGLEEHTKDNRAAGKLLRFY